ncbi:MAG TPA: prepilin-type N-terminal cleavage/methylation domain-containing protein [Xanthomonadaceae bacterium]|nr:prepilin-type N-terminal cleavage/methylation domain-containing protein [Xanthomonadaceae bacterium]
MSFPCHRARRTVTGVTLIELMIALALIAIGMALAVPAFTEFRQRAAVRGAVEQYMTILAEQRFEAVKRNEELTVDFTGVTMPSGASVSAYTMTDGGDAGKVVINPRDGMLAAGSVAGSVTVTSGNYQLRFTVNLLGRGSVCAPVGHSVPGYRDCAS